MNDNSVSFGTFIGGVILGGLVGAGIAILTAPQSGQETIADLKAKSDQIRKELEQATENYKKQADQLIGNVQAQVDEAGKKAQKAVSK